MADKTGIAWTDATWNPVRGCSRVSEGCRNCYAEVMAARFSGPGQAYEGLATTRGDEARWTGEVRFVEEHLRDPLKWKKPRRIFVNSMSDLFHEKLTDAEIDKVFAVMALAKQHTFQILTKRPQRMNEYVRGVYGSDRAADLNRAAREVSGLDHIAIMPTQAHGMVPLRWPLPNAWLGVSAENNSVAHRILELRDTPAAVRFVSAEPLIGRLDVLEHLYRVNDADRGTIHPIDWVIIGGESGPNHRPMDPDWLFTIVAQCQAGGCACFVKQDSGQRPGMQGRIHDDFWSLKEFPR